MIWPFIKSIFTTAKFSKTPQEMNAALARNERIFRSTHGYGYFDWDLASKRILWSGGYWRYLGYGDDDAEKISFSSSYFEYVHVDDVQQLREIVQKLLKAELLIGEARYRVRRKNGGYVWTEVRADTTRNDQGWVTHISGIAFDIDKQKHIQQALLISEQRHARIIEASNDGIWEWVVADHGFQFTKRCWEHLGFTNVDEIVGPNQNPLDVWRERMHPEDLKYFDKVLGEHIRKKGCFDVEYRIRGKNDIWFWIRARGKMIFNEDGTPLRMSGSNMDITALKLAEERVLNAKDQAERANLAKSEFLSSMSHEFRTPLNAILGYSQILSLEHGLLPEQKQHVREITRAGDILYRLINDCLDLARIESGHLSFVYKSLYPVQLIQYCLNLVKKQAKSHNISLIFNPTEFASLTLNADQTRLEQIFLNLLSNSVKYNRERGRVNISCNIVEDTYFRVIVQDTGKGIAMKKQALIFQPFNRLGEENSTIEGSGVGLVITQRLILQMGGRIGFSSQEAVGSRFWVDIPLQSSLSELNLAQEDIRPAENEQSGVLECVSARHILYIEDNQSNQRLMRHFLSRYPQIQLEIANDALKGLFYVRTKRPDLVIMDINLPDMNGYEALEVLQADLATAHIPVIALSANAMRHDIDKGLEAGFAHYLTKPLELNRLIAVLNKCL